jgi:uncharacterized protein
MEPLAGFGTKNRVLGGRVLSVCAFAGVSMEVIDSRAAAARALVRMLQIKRWCMGSL